MLLFTTHLYEAPIWKVSPVSTTGAPGSAAGRPKGDRNTPVRGAGASWFNGTVGEIKKGPLGGLIGS